MTHQLVIPPASVWTRIEKELDEQDKRQKFANTVIAESITKVNQDQRRRNLYYAAASVSLLAGIFLVTKVKLGV